MTPQVVVDQRLAALVRANETRTANAKTASAIRSLPKAQACDFVASMIEDPDGRVGSMPVARLLRSIPQVGTKRVDSLLRRIDIRTPSRRVDELTERQRAQLARLLRAAQSFPNS